VQAGLEGTSKPVLSPSKRGSSAGPAAEASVPSHGVRVAVQLTSGPVLEPGLLADCWSSWHDQHRGAVR